MSYIYQTFLLQIVTLFQIELLIEFLIDLGPIRYQKFHLNVITLMLNKVSILQKIIVLRFFSHFHPYTKALNSRNVPFESLISLTSL
ncbi:hypothetical protein GCM10022410_13280 [Amphibacillus indicireducens]|uniref:Uncharacterized protein n=1 Tax=Amphibacillus indicireducens TaxID=1076330 RepID=A0ABP7VJY7_9BACI